MNQPFTSPSRISLTPAEDLARVAVSRCATRPVAYLMNLVSAIEADQARPGGLVMHYAHIDDPMATYPAIDALAAATGFNAPDSNVRWDVAALLRVQEATGTTPRAFVSCLLAADSYGPGINTVALVLCAPSEPEALAWVGARPDPAAIETLLALRGYDWAVAQMNPTGQRVPA